MLGLLLFGLLCVYVSIGSWRGVYEARSAPRIPGVAHDVQCGRGRGTVCSGSFTSDDGHVRALPVRIEVSSSGPTIRGVLVRKIDTGLVHQIQSEDTVYPNGVNFSIALSLVIAVVLDLVALLVLSPFLVGAVQFALGRTAPQLRRKAAQRSAPGPDSPERPR